MWVVMHHDPACPLVTWTYMWVTLHGSWHMYQACMRACEWACSETCWLVSAGMFGNEDMDSQPQPMFLQLHHLLVM